VREGRLAGEWGEDLVRHGAGHAAAAAGGEEDGGGAAHEEGKDYETTGLQDNVEREIEIWFRRVL
jgi:hypothetical protein